MKLSAIVDAVIAELMERGLRGLIAEPSDLVADLPESDEPEPPSVETETVKTARAVAVRVRMRPPMRVAEFTHGIPADFIEPAIALAVERQWVTLEGDLLHAGPVNPELPEEPEPESPRARQMRWGPEWIG